MSVGTTRLNGNAGPLMDIKAFLAGDLSEANVPVIVSNFGWSYGVGVNAVNIVYADKVTLADAANDTLDLFASGSLLDIFGRALTLSAIKFLYIKNNSADASLLVGGGVALDLDLFSDTSDQMIIPPGGVMLWLDPSAAGVSTAVNKNLYLEHDGTGSDSMDVDVIAMGLD